MISMKWFRRGAAEEVMLDCFEQWLKSDKFMNAIEHWNISYPMCMWQVAGLITQHGDSTVDEGRLTQLHNELGQMDMTKKSLRQSISS